MKVRRYKIEFEVLLPDGVKDPLDAARLVEQVWDREKTEKQAQIEDAYSFEATFIERSETE